MSLSLEEKVYWKNVIDTTGAHREVMFQARSIPEEYTACQDRVVRSSITVDVPAVSVPVKCYVSMAKGKMQGCPVHINMHGGGFYFGQNGDDDMYCAHLAAETKGIVVDIDYALCPDYPFPVAFEQCYEVTRWVFDQCKVWEADPRRVSIGGHSSGGNLAAGVSLKAAASKDFRLCLQMLDYAALDLATDPADIVCNYESGADSHNRSRAFNAFYSDGDPNLMRSPFASPALAVDEMLAGLPAALIITGGKCPFRALGESYGLRMATQGVEVSIKRFTESRHGFTVRMMDEWQQAQATIIRAIQSARIKGD